MVTVAQVGDFDAIGALNAEAFREFAAHMSPEDWRSMEARIRAIESRAQLARFLMVKDHETIVGSVGYCPAGKSDLAIFPTEWAAVLLLAVAPAHRGRGIARTLVSACIQCARDDAAQAIGLFTSEVMTAAQQLYESMGFRRDGELPPKYGLRYRRYKLPLNDFPD